MGPPPQKNQTNKCLPQYFQGLTTILGDEGSIPMEGRRSMLPVLRFLEVQKMKKTQQNYDLSQGPWVLVGIVS